MDRLRAQAFAAIVGTALGVFALAGEGACCNVRVLLVGSHGRGADNWISRQAYPIENFLHFNGIPYDFFDVYLDTLDQETLSGYRGVILEGNSMRWDATEAERQLIAANMEAGNVSALLGLIDGRFTELNSTLYAAIDVAVDGEANDQANIHLLDGATDIYDINPVGFIVTGGCGGQHLGMAMLPLGSWTFQSGPNGAPRTYGLEFALETWFGLAFGIDTRVTVPVISLRMDDTQCTSGQRHQEVMDFIDANKDRLRASGYLVTDASAYHGSDSTLMNDEQILSRWGSMSLHGKDHASVGAEGENQTYETQRDETAAAVDFLATNFSRYKPIKACPNNSWNAATLDALYANGIFYHSADMSMSAEYRALYKSLFDVASDEERERMNSRFQSQMRYYPLIHEGECGTARVYSVDWHALFSGTTYPGDVLTILKAHALDWWTPLVASMHFYLPGSGGANNDPTGWMGVMGALMDAVDEASYPWRRWVDNYDLARNVQRFDQDLAVNNITLAGDVVTYDLTAASPIRFLTLRAAKPGYAVEAVTIDGEEYRYFGDDYVHLPEIAGDVLVDVHLAPAACSRSRVTHISPNAVVEDADCVGDRLRLTLGGEFLATAQIAGPPRAFSEGETWFFPAASQRLYLDVSSHKQTEQVNLALTPSSGWVSVRLDDWLPSDTERRTWRETVFLDDCPFGEPGTVGFARRHDLAWQSHGPRRITVEHRVGDLAPDSLYVVSADAVPIDTCRSSHEGALSFDYCPIYGQAAIEVVLASRASGAGAPTPPLADLATQDFTVTACPNPFTSRTAISCQIRESADLTLAIYSAAGTLVYRHTTPVSPPGPVSLEWSGRDADGDPAAPGVYLCRLDTRAARHDFKIVLLR